MNYRRLKWVAILAPLVLVGVLEYSRYALAPAMGSWQEWLLMVAVVSMGAVFFYGAVLGLIDQMHGRLEAQNRELLALRDASFDIGPELSLEVVLHKIVDQARVLLRTRYGALSVQHEDGSIKAFVTSGLNEVEVRRIGAPPIGKGLLGVVLREGQRLRIDEIQSDPRSCGFPQDHPSMRSLLAVPVVCRSPFRGNLYLSEKLDGESFSIEEEETLVRFAAQAAMAVDNAHLHAQVGGLAVAEERLRIAREMHDGQAQVLAYVNTKAQVVRELLRAGNGEQADQHLEQLASAAREVYADVREGILGLRSVIDEEHGFSASLRRFVEQWQDQSGIVARLELDELDRYPTDVELQLLRILQEALANVRKHSGAERVTVRARKADGGLWATVEDDGVGFELSPPDEGPRGPSLGPDGAPSSLAFKRGRRPRFGLATMRERAEAIGARLKIESEVGEGTRLILEYQGPDPLEGTP